MFTHHTVVPTPEPKSKSVSGLKLGHLRAICRTTSCTYSHLHVVCAHTHTHTHTYTHTHTHRHTHTHLVQDPGRGCIGCIEPAGNVGHSLSPVIPASTRCKMVELAFLFTDICTTHKCTVSCSQLIFCQGYVTLPVHTHKDVGKCTIATLSNYSVTAPYQCVPHLIGEYFSFFLAFICTSSPLQPSTFSPPQPSTSSPSRQASSLPPAAIRFCLFLFRRCNSSDEGGALPSR